VALVLLDHEDKGFLMVKENQRRPTKRNKRQTANMIDRCLGLYAGASQDPARR
jgi:hypothetical protein